jgi:hypothetical protein
MVIRITGLPYRRGDRVEIIILPQTGKTRILPCLTVRQLRQSGLIGLWKDGSDIGVFDPIQKVQPL